MIASQPHSWLADNLAEEVSSKQLLKTPCTIDIQVPGIAMSQRRVLRAQQLQVAGAAVAVTLM